MSLFIMLSVIMLGVAFSFVILSVYMLIVVILSVGVPSRFFTPQYLLHNLWMAQ
jgi:hypothetical protein